MIEAHHTFSAHVLLRMYLSRAFKKYFHGVYLLDSIPDIPQEEPIILAPNHSSWWDGFLSYIINQTALQRKFYILMLEEELKKRPFFSKVGAFSIDPYAPKQITRSVHYMSTLCVEKKNICLTFFPQGAIMPNVPGAFKLKEGLTLVNPKKTAWIVPAYYHLESGRQPKPLYYVTLGTPVNFSDYKENPELLTEAFTETQALCARSLLSPTSSWRTLYGATHKPIIELC
jgi:1-acyl-sn-glycerol-3-phosphate acyltransferase